MADAKEKINLLDVIPFRSENITAEKGSDGTVTIAFPRFKYEWMRRFFIAQRNVSGYSCPAGRTWYCRMGVN